MVCKSCGYINRDGVEFCRHCGITLKEKKRRPVKVRASAKKESRYAEISEYSLTAPNKKTPESHQEEEERMPRGGVNYKKATIAAGIVVFVCVIAFCIFAFDIPALFRPGGSVIIESITVTSNTPEPEPTPSFTPVPTVVSSTVEN